MTAFGNLVHALKATVLVVLLSLGWAIPVQAHSGHAKSRAVAAAEAIPQDARLTVTAASPRPETVEVCEPSAQRASEPAGDCPQNGGSDRSCCGTMCTSAVIEHAVAWLPLRVSHRIRLGLPPEHATPEQAPGLDARPPRTIDIA